MRNKFRSAIVAALAATITLTSLNLTPAQAASKNASHASNAASTEFSARRYHRGNSRAAMAMFGLVVGSIAAAAAADRYNDGYYGGGPYYGGYGYGPRYGYGGWHHHWR